MLDHSPHATQCPLMPGHQVLSSSHSLPRPPLAIESHCADEQTNPPSQGLPTVTQPGTHTMCPVCSVSPLLTPVLCPQVKGLLRRQHTKRGAEATVTTLRWEQRPSQGSWPPDSLRAHWKLACHFSGPREGTQGMGDDLPTGDLWHHPGPSRPLSQGRVAPSSSPLRAEVAQTPLQARALPLRSAWPAPLSSGGWITNVLPGSLCHQ